jgi:hypothetical protein
MVSFGTLHSCVHDVADRATENVECACDALQAQHVIAVGRDVDLVEYLIVRLLNCCAARLPAVLPPQYLTFRGLQPGTKEDNVGYGNAAPQPFYSFLCKAAAERVLGPGVLTKTCPSESLARGEPNTAIRAYHII